MTRNEFKKFLRENWHKIPASDCILSSSQTVFPISIFVEKDRRASYFKFEESFYHAEFFMYSVTRETKIVDLKKICGNWQCINPHHMVSADPFPQNRSFLDSDWHKILWAVQLVEQGFSHREISIIVEIPFPIAKFILDTNVVLKPLYESDFSMKNFMFGLEKGDSVFLRNTETKIIQRITSKKTNKSYIFFVRFDDNTSEFYRPFGQSNFFPSPSDILKVVSARNNVISNFSVQNLNQEITRTGLEMKELRLRKGFFSICGLTDLKAGHLLVGTAAYGVCPH